MNIIYEDQKKIIVNKPAGKLTQGAKSFDLDLTSELMSYRKKKSEKPYVAVINRLDRPVSGLVLFAKDQAEAARLSRLSAKEGFCKQYYAILCGKPKENQGTLVDYLLKNERENVSVVSNKDVSGAKRSELEYKVLRYIQDETGRVYTLVQIHLITGRHHQIRVQFSSRGLPLLGDVKYGKEEDATNAGIHLKKNEIALCAYSMTVDGINYEVRPDWL
jgi:23S rRNA pseudouridine1911/1915/1917 synthase